MICWVHLTIITYFYVLYSAAAAPNTVESSDSPSLYTAATTAKYKKDITTPYMLKTAETANYTAKSQSSAATTEDHTLTRQATTSQPTKSSQTERTLTTTQSILTPLIDDNEPGSGDQSDRGSVTEYVGEGYDDYFEVFESPVGREEEYLHPTRGDMAATAEDLSPIQGADSVSGQNPDDEDSLYGQMMALNSNDELIVGQKGERGEPGLPGAPGFDGDNGVRGERGEPGGVGLPGLQGHQGIKGNITLHTARQQSISVIHKIVMQVCVFKFVCTA